MSYIQIDKFGGNINIVCKNDDSGEPLLFDTLQEAEDTLNDNCQDGIIVDLNGKNYTFASLNQYKELIKRKYL